MADHFAARRDFDAVGVIGGVARFPVRFRKLRRFAVRPAFEIRPLGFFDYRSRITHRVANEFRAFRRVLHDGLGTLPIVGGVFVENGPADAFEIRVPGHFEKFYAHVFGYRDFQYALGEGVVALGYVRYFAVPYRNRRSGRGNFYGSDDGEESFRALGIPCRHFRNRPYGNLSVFGFREADFGPAGECQRISCQTRIGSEIDVHGSGRDFRRKDGFHAFALREVRHGFERSESSGGDRSRQYHARDDDDRGVGELFSERAESGYPREHEERRSRGGGGVGERRMRSSEEVLVFDHDSAHRNAERREERNRSEGEKQREERKEEEAHDTEEDAEKRQYRLRGFRRDGRQRGRDVADAFFDPLFGERLRIPDLRSVFHEDSEHEVRDDARSVEEEQEYEKEADEERVDVEFVAEPRAHSENHALRAVAVEGGFHVVLHGIRDIAEPRALVFRSFREGVFRLSDFVHYAHGVGFGAFSAHCREFFGQPVFDVLRVFGADSVGGDVRADSFEVFAQKRLRGGRGRVFFPGNVDGGHGDLVSGLVFTDSFDRLGEFFPRVLHEYERFASSVGQPVVFSRRASGGFDPVVRDEAVVLHAGEERVERSFHHDEVSFLEGGDNVRSVGFPMPDDHQYRVLEYALAHLRGDFFRFAWHGNILVLCNAR